MRTETASLPRWTGCPFGAQIYRSGRLGIVEQGTAADVPDEVRRQAMRMLSGGVSRVSYVRAPDGDEPVCTVTLEARPDAAVGHVVATGRPVDDLPHALSLRELEVLTLLVAGLGNAEIAGELWISERTTAVHVNHILRKLGVSTRTAAATHALDEGLLHVPLPGKAEHFGAMSLSRVLREDVGRTVGERCRPLPAPTRPRDLVVGAIVPGSGKGSDDGKEMLNGLQLAVEEINAAGGIRGRSVRTVVHDVDATASGTVRDAFEGLLRSGADILTSGYLAAQDVAHEVAAASGVPYLHAATSGVMEQAVQRDLTRFGRVFQVCASDTTYAPAFVSYMTQLRDNGEWHTDSRRLVVLQKGWQHVNFGIVEATALADLQGWHLDCVTVTGPEDGDGWQRAVHSALREPAAAVMIGSFFVDDAVQAVEALRASGSRALPYAIYAPSVPSFRHALDDTADGVLWATMTGTYSDRTGVEFARRYRERFGVSPGRSHAGLAYDRMHRIALAWRSSNDLSDAGELATHLRLLTYRGVNGTYNFDTPGQAAQGFDDDEGDPSMAQPQLIYQIQSGRQVIVSGGPFRTGSFRAPTAS